VIKKEKRKEILDKILKHTKHDYDRNISWCAQSKKIAPTTLHQVTKHKNTIEKVNFKYAVPFQVI